MNKTKTTNIGSKVIATNDWGNSWRVGNVANIEDDYITILFFNPNSGDSTIGVYDLSDDSTNVEEV